MTLGHLAIKELEGVQIRDEDIKIEVRRNGRWEEIGASELV